MPIIRSLSFYPAVLLGGLLLFMLRVLGWFCLIGFLLIGVLRLAGELEVSWLIVASVGAGAIMALALADLLIEFLAGLNLAGQERRSGSGAPTAKCRY